MSNPLQRGEYKQTLCRIRGLGAFDPWPELRRPVQVGSFNVLGGYRDGRAECKTPVEWTTVSLHALEAVRYVEEPPETGVAALDRGDLESLARSTLWESTIPQAQAMSGLFSPFRASAYSLLKARITWTDETANQTAVVVDVGGGVVASFPTSQVTAEFLLPENSVAFAQPPGRAAAGSAPRPVLPPAPGIYLDSFLEASYTQSHSAPIGRRAARMTVPVVLGGDGDARLVKVPQHAVEASVYGPVTAAWSIEPVLMFTDEIPLVANGAGAFELRQPIFGLARWIRLANTAVGPANAGVTFTLEF